MEIRKIRERVAKLEHRVLTVVEELSRVYKDLEALEGVKSEEDYGKYYTVEEYINIKPEYKSYESEYLPTLNKMARDFSEHFKIPVRGGNKLTYSEAVLYIVFQTQLKSDLEVLLKPE